MSATSRRRRLFLLVIPLLVSAGCGSSGRELREPERGAVQPTRSSTAPTSSTLPPTTLQLVAEGFEPGGTIPPANACNGQAPALQWSGVPAGTAEVAVGLVDFDEPDVTRRVRWLVTGIPASGTSGSLPAGGAPPAGAVTLTNGLGTPGYAGPCPAATGGVHTYNFMVFALPQPSGITAETTAAEAYSRLEGAAGGDIAYFTGTL